MPDEGTRWTYPDETATRTDVQARAIAPLPEAEPDALLYRLLIGGLVAAVLLIILGSLVLTGLGRDVNEAVVAIGAAAVGYLGGVLTPAPNAK